MIASEDAQITQATVAIDFPFVFDKLLCETALVCRCRSDLRHQGDTELFLVRRVFTGQQRVAGQLGLEG